MTAVRQASCRCGQLTVRCEGEPVRISVCHCLDCKKRSGSAFTAQARFPAEKVDVQGRFNSWSRTADNGLEVVYCFCPECGSTLFYRGGSFEGLVAVPVGNFADPAFPAPAFSVWEKRKHSWVAVLGDEVRHSE